MGSDCEIKIWVYSRVVVDELYYAYAMVLHFYQQILTPLFDVLVIILIPQDLHYAKVHREL